MGGIGELDSQKRKKGVRWSHLLKGKPLSVDWRRTKRGDYWGLFRGGEDHRPPSILSPEKRAWDREDYPHRRAGEGGTEEAAAQLESREYTAVPWNGNE